MIEMRGQVSLEFLFIFAACLSMLAVLFAGFGTFLDAGNFFLELKSAQEFSENLDSVISETYSFSDGTERIISFPLNFDWIVSSSERKVSVEVVSEKNSKKIEFISTIPLNDFSFHAEKELTLIISKENGIVSVKNNSVENN
ncbi:MAG: hypothetical protein JW703_01155 [Candidatus Diapherotrites archaeon]|nr:hypothetical protein [Candidatus Diapherotrites archaeon]